jgi:hypothetical protein
MSGKTVLVSSLKRCCRAEIHLYTFSASKLDYTDSRTSRLIPLKQAPGTNRLGGQVDAQGVVDGFNNRKISNLTRNRTMNPQTYSSWPATYRLCCRGSHFRLCYKVYVIFDFLSKRGWPSVFCNVKPCNLMEQSPSSEASRFSRSQEISTFYGIRKFNTPFTSAHNLPLS